MKHARWPTLAGRVPTLLASICLAGCASAKFIPTGKSYPARPETCQIEVFSTKTPDRPYEELGILEGESGALGDASLEKVLPQMKKKACLAGGDAIILTSREKSVSVQGTADTSISSTEELNVAATVIRWVEAED